MKKKLEGELISIAHRILKLKNKSELAQLHHETQNLYQKLSVLLFFEENFSEVKPTIGTAEIEEKLEAAFETQTAVAKTPEVTPEVFEEVNAATEPELKEGFDESENADEKTETEQDEVSEEKEATEVVEETEIPETIAEEAKAADEEHETVVTEEETSEKENVTEEVTSEESETEEKPNEEITDDTFQPSFELAFDPKEDTLPTKQITFEDLLGHSYSDPIFDKVGESHPKPEESPQPEPKVEEEPKVTPEAPVEEPTPEPIPQEEIKEEKTEPKPAPLGEIHGKSITFGLNDRIGFEKQLFGGSSEDMNRVVSQLSTFNSFAEAQEFIEDMVKPDYNNWDGKDDYAERFMAIVEKKFS